ncbi:FecCD family ABC transporter permease [Stackebrandtia nassauensis]|uniref:Transport system permease protein n=1 Tax=Stackebrandtia nassauensis (strain DSM 44728 / CIP 108903 / NRRL B-16338 / NBRC 102104 / LLR-40K-21) TaxID=446470 RepID=D3PYK9_STANL|nr:iron ABC transporter permease [Stackebrandtia nassauensis]ADD43442.1 transport system permease protein [Stackebrandtia nassauensis DSM 44728]
MTTTPATTRSPAARHVLVLAAGLVLLAAAVIVGLGVGARSVPPAEVVRALFAFDGGDDHLVVHDVRIPRALLGIGVGAALAVAGVLIQTLTRNPLAEPGLLGVTSGAGFTVILGAAAGLATGAVTELGFAALGAVAAATLVYAVGRSSPLRLVLTGVALSAVLTGIGLGLRLMLPDVFDQYRFWSVGSLAGREQAPLAVPLTVIGLALVAALLLSRPLAAVSLGDTVAHTLGANVTRIRLSALIVVTTLVGAATAVAGPILFVGLIVPQLARRLATGSVGWLIGYAVVLGAILMLAADTIARVLLPTGEVPVAIVTAFLGGPALIAAVRRDRTVAT